MKKLYITLIIALFLCVSSFAQNVNAIEPELQSVLNQRGDGLIDIHIYFKSDIDTEDLKHRTRDITDGSTKKAVIIGELKAHSEEAQSDVMSILEAEELNGSVSDIRSLWIVNSVICKASSDVIYKLSSHPDVKSIGYDKEIQVISPEMMQSAVDVESQQSRGPVAHVVTVKADQVWEQGYTGKNVIVAVLDSGTNYKHKDLADHLWEGYVDTDNDGTPDKLVNGWNFIENSSNISDDYGHGTHCAGIVCSDGTSGQTAGVAPDASLMTVKTINRAGGGTVAQMLSGVQFAVDNGAQVLSMSLGYKNNQITVSQKEEIREAFDNVLELGVIVCAAAGNDGNTYGAPNNIDYPAACPAPWSSPDQTLKGGLSSVICVGADDLVGQSSQGPSTWEGTSYNDYPYNNGEYMGLIRPDISAPGNMVYSTNHLYNDKYKLMSGTSQATPCVAGVIALMLEKNSSITPAQISQIIEETATNKPDAKNNIVGAGSVDALAAVNTVSEGEMKPYIRLQSFTPKSIMPGSNTASITVMNEGKGVSAANTSVTLSLTNDPYVTIDNPTQTVGVINCGEISALDFDFNVDTETPNGHAANFIVTITSDGFTWRDKFSIRINTTPDIVFQSVSPNIIDNNASTDISVMMYNNGATMTSPITLTLSTIAYDLQYISIVNDKTTIEPIGMGETGIGTFTVKTNENTPENYPFDLFLETYMESNEASNYVYEFENDMEGWTCFDAGNNGVQTPWWHSSDAVTHGKDSKDSHSGSGHVMSETSDSGLGYYSKPIDHYLVSPKKVIATNNSEISFYARAHHNAYYREHFGVAVSTSGNTSKNDFTTLEDWIIPAEQSLTWTKYTVDLSRYAGQEVYVAIRHFFTSEEWDDPYQADGGYMVYALNVDDIVFSDVIVNTHHIPTYSYDDPYYFNVVANNIIDLPKVENLAATVDSHSQVTLTWNAVEQAQSYNIYRNGQRVANTAETTYTDQGLSHSTQYCYEVAAAYSSMDFEHSDEACVTTLKKQYSVTMTDYSPDTIYIDENDNELRLSLLNDGSESFLSDAVIILSTEDQYITFDANSIELGSDFSSPNATTEVTFGISIDKYIPNNHNITIKATVVSCHHNDPDFESVDYCLDDIPVFTILVRNELASPMNLTASDCTLSTITLSWDSVSYATGYNIYMGNTLLANVTETSYIVENLTKNTEYCFTISAVRNDEESLRSDEACGKTLNDDGIEETTISFDIYPNPVKNEVRISSRDVVEEVTIYNVNGQKTKVNSHDVSSTDVIINVEHLNAGVYFVKVRTVDGETVRRILKL